MRTVEKIEGMDLAERWKKVREEREGIRIRDAAEVLRVTEGELLATEVGASAVRLRPEFQEIFGRLDSLGRVMALTRNQEVVHERKGTYGTFEAVSGHGNMGLVLGDDIDLRIFFSSWAHAFAVTSEGQKGTLHSLQFFDRHGDAIHKIYLTEDSETQAYVELVLEFMNEDQSGGISVVPREARPSELPDEEIDVEGFRNAWRSLKDTHDFFPLIRKFKVGREQALRLADREFAYPVPADSFKFVLNTAAERHLPIMVFVGNGGMIQIHTGEVEKVLEARGWFNVMDERFNLHIDQSNIGSAWVVRKPTDDGIVTSLEIFNAEGENVALFFGKRKPGIPEMEEWRQLVAEIERIEAAGAA